MSEFIKKLIGRFEKESHIKYDQLDDGYCFDAEHFIYTSDAIRIVNELAEEYKGKSNIIYDLKAFLKEKFKYNSEQTEIWRDGSDNDAYFRQQKDLYMDRANIYGEVMREIERLSEEYKVSEMPTGWIACKEEMPEAGTQRDVWISIENEVISYKAKWYLDHFEWENGWVIKENILAWMPNDVPAPYTEGE